MVWRMPIDFLIDAPEKGLVVEYAVRTSHDVFDRTGVGEYV